MNSATILNSMEHLFNSYKRIIGEAVNLGVIPDINDKKLYYLSSNDSDASDCIDTEAKDLQFQTQAEMSHPSLLNATEVRRYSIPTEHSSKNEQAFDNPSLEDQISEKTKESIENYSILGIKNFQKMENCNADSDSDLSSYPENDCKTSPQNPLVTSRIKLNAVRKKPKKNEVVNLQVPIYPCLKKKKTRIKLSKVKGKNTVRNKASIKTEPSKQQNDVVKESCMEQEMSKYFMKPSRSKQCPRIQKRMNLTQYDRKDIESRNYYNPSETNNNCKHYVYETHQNCERVRELSPQKCKKAIYPSNANSRIPVLKQSKYREDNPAPLTKIIETATSVFEEKRNLHQTRQTSLNAMQVCHVRDLSENTKLSPKSKTSRKFHCKKTSPTAYASKELVQNFPSKKCFCKAVKLCNHSDEIKTETTSDDVSFVESTDSETANKKSEKLLNLNIICQFFPNNTSPKTEESIISEQSSHPEQGENYKSSSTEQEMLPPKEKVKHRSAAHFLSKIFSRSSKHPHTCKTSDSIK
ncbi:uncharacterized protein NPIL_168991 [Nephila pilipes]|uniref:Uncharacterized protein n=1 Tax=Nephila pilipes TaxID=299642 RepID=A0A8X6Q2C9_NEPPI|nr:uncharacterized protein NPIL_168991 [Nephila pilipes]